MRKRKLITAAAVAGAVIFAVWLGYVTLIPFKADKTNPIEVLIKRGLGLNKIADILKDNGVIKNKLIFRIYAVLLGKGDSLEAGRYVFSEPLNMYRVILALDRGFFRSEDVEIVIPEGSNVWDIDEKLTKLGLINEGDFAKKYHDEEGYLFPDTYRLKDKELISLLMSQASSQIEQNLSDYYINDLRKKMSDNFNQKIETLLKNKSNREKKEIIIKASILEKEVRTEKDMRLVAGIINKRVAMGIPLQVDASVSYGACLKKAQQNNFSKNCDTSMIGVAKEINIDSKYNTYIRESLPAGPISSPGLKSIMAVLNPQTSNYLYYLSTAEGQIIYSKTGWEHEMNRKKYLGF